MGAPARSAAIHPHLPGRAMTDDSVLLIPGDVLRGHSGKKIVGMIVSANVLQAEPPVFPFAHPSFWRAVGRRRLAVRPFAGRVLAAKPAILVGLDPDAIEEGRVAFHDRSVCARPQATFKP